MKPFHHLNVFTVEEAINILMDYQGKARIISGGTDLLGVLKDRILPEYPEVLVNIKTISGLDDIVEDSTGLKIGSLVKLADLINSPIIKEKFKVLAQAAQAVGTPQLRNMGTIGGNLGQDTRCWYYRYPHSIGGRISCLRKGSGPCLAVAGDNRYHAIFGGRKCFAVCPSDMAVALSVLNAGIKTIGPKGSRIIPIQDFYNPLGNALEPGEIIVEIQVPHPPANAHQQFLKYTVRQPIDFAIVSVATLVVPEEGVCSEGRIALGAVAPGPLRASNAEEILNGKRLDAKTLEEAAEKAVKEAKPLSMNGYKVEVTRTLVARALRLPL
ncbi:MAG: xanthine dehydrogenase family protein subunit M [Clostridia bacterium]|jgi:xanthine dehydrogenase YagS FAD-binding subunit|nr:xanthine dehydrogenase family protein subunit M [Clostridia bacterium]